MVDWMLSLCDNGGELDKGKTLRLMMNGNVAFSSEEKLDKQRQATLD